MTVTSCAGKHMTSRLFLILVLPSRWLIFRNFFHAVNIAIKQQQYCNKVRPQLSSDRFTQHMSSQTWRLERLFLNESFAFNPRHKDFTTSIIRLQTAIFWLFKWNTLIWKELIFCCQCPLRWNVHLIDCIVARHWSALLIHYSINWSVFYMRIFNMYLELGEILFRTRLNIVVISKCDILSNLNSDRAEGLWWHQYQHCNYELMKLVLIFSVIEGRSTLHGEQNKIGPVWMRKHFYLYRWLFTEYL